MEKLIYCLKCGIKCSGKMQLLDHKLNTQPVCSNCFMETEMVEHAKEARRKSKSSSS